MVNLLLYNMIVSWIIKRESIRKEEGEATERTLLSGGGQLILLELSSHSLPSSPYEAPHCGSRFAHQPIISNWRRNNWLFHKREGWAQRG